MTSERAVEPDTTANDGHVVCRREQKLARDLAGHRVEGIHDCFLMNCRDLGPEVVALYDLLAAARGEPPEPAGTETRCPLGGVHEHVFRGPHRFREWEPGT